MVAFGGYLVLAYITDDGGGNARPARVQWSNTGDPETWTGGNTGSVELLEDPEDITGITTYGNFIAVHKPNSIYLGQLVTTSAVFRFDRKATGAGAVNVKSIQNIITGDQVFLATDGIRIFNGITAPLVPAPIQDEIREQLNPNYLLTCTSIIKEEDDEVWFAMPIGSQTKPETVYKYNYRTNQIYKDARTDLTVLGLYLNTNEKTWDNLVGTWDEQAWRWNDIELNSLNPVVAFGDDTGKVTRYDSSTANDDGVAVTSQFETKDFTAQDLQNPDFGILVRWTALQIWAKGTDLTVDYSINSGSSWTTIGSLSLSSDYPTDDAPDYLWFDVVSSKIRFRFKKTGLAQTFNVKKYYVEAVTRELRR